MGSQPVSEESRYHGEAEPAAYAAGAAGRPEYGKERGGGSNEIIALKNMVTPIKTQNKLSCVDQDLLKINSINENFAVGKMCFL